MPRKIRRALAVTALIGPLAAAALAGTASADPATGGGTTVYTQTNASTGNAVLAFRRVHGVLTQVGSFATGGLGSGNGLGSQGALAAADHLLFAVDAGSNQLSVFRIGEHGALHLSDVEPTGGILPVSVTVSDDAAYVLNTGDASVSGFRILGASLQPIAGSHQLLAGMGGAQISFDRDGQRLVVTEKGTSTIDVLPVRHDVAGPAVSNPSSGTTPFGFAIDGHNRVIVSNADGGATLASSLSSYALSGPASLTTISAAVADNQTAACWVALSEDGRYAYTTNTGSNSISSYRVAADGSLTLLQAVAASPGAAPTDMAVADDTLVTLASASHTISTDEIGPGGALTPDMSVSVPAGVVGLAIG